MPKVQKYYAVKRGHKTGIFATWEECRAQVNGCPGSLHQSFKSIEEAESWLMQEIDTIMAIRSTPKQEKQKKPKKASSSSAVASPSPVIRPEPSHPGYHGETSPLSTLVDASRYPNQAGYGPYTSGVSQASQSYESAPVHWNAPLPAQEEPNPYRCYDHPMGQAWEHAEGSSKGTGDSSSRGAPDPVNNRWAPELADVTHGGVTSAAFPSRGFQHDYHGVQIDPGCVYVLEFDGACKVNPGRAGAGAVLIDPWGKGVRYITEGIALSTNKHAEYRALVAGLEVALQLGIRRIHVTGDSQLVIQQCKGVYQVRSPELKPLATRARELLSQFDTHTLELVTRDCNKTADQLSRDAILLEDAQRIVSEYHSFEARS